MLIKSQLFGKIYQSAASIWYPEHDHVVDRNFNVVAVLKSDIPKPVRYIPAFIEQLLPQSLIQPEIVLASNIVTNCGDIHYAERSATEAVTNSFAYTYMCTSRLQALGKTITSSDFVLVGSSGKEQTATYPQTDDSDGDNTGAGIDIVTWLVTYAAADFTANGITDGVISNSGEVDVGGGVLLTGFTFVTSFNKAITDTLKVFVNHQLDGV